MSTPELLALPDEPAILADRRRTACDLYEALPVPRRPRTPLKARRLEAIAYLEETAPDPSEVPVVLRSAPGSAGHVVLSNGHVVSCRLGAAASRAGVRLLSLAEAAQHDADFVAQHLGSLVAPATDRYAAANAAFWRDGVLLVVPRGVALSEPITVVHWVGSAAAGVFPRTLILAQDEASAAVVETFMGEPTDTHRVLVSATTEVIAGPGSHVSLSALQQLPPGAEAFLRRRGRAHQDARIDWATAEFGAALSVAGHHTDLAESGASTTSHTVTFGSGAQHFDYDAEVVHFGAHTTSDMRARGVMSGRSRGIFTGLSEIRKGARRADARQKEETLMMSSDARADAIPSLLIDDNDVFAAHAASAGPVDELALYYLASRGIPRADAVALLVRGFLGPVVERIALPAVQDRIWQAIEGKLQEERGRGGS